MCGNDARFRDLVEITSDLIWEVDAEGRYTYFGPRVRDLLGYEPEELLGKTPVDLLPPEDRPQFEALFRAVRDAHQPVRSLENRNVRKDGRLVLLETNAVPFFDSSGRLQGYRGMDRDITARKQAEEALRDSEARFRAIFEGAAIGIALVDREGRIVASNPVLQRMLGYSEEVLRGMSFRAITHAEDVAEDERLLREMLAGKFDHYQLVKRYLRKDGQVIWARLTTSLVHSVTGATFGVGMVEDITDQHRAEESLRFIAQASDVLASSLDYEATLQRVVRLAVPFLADWCVVEVFVDGPESPVLVAHVDPAKERIAHEMQRRYPPGPQIYETYREMLLTHRPIIVPEVTPSLLEKIAQDAEHLRMIRELGPTSFMVVPLLSHGRILGAIFFAAAGSGRRYGQEDVTLAEDLARRAALAVDNAQAYRREAAARAEAEQRAAELDATLAAVPNGLAIYGPHAEIIRLNAAAERILGFSAAERALPLAERAAALRVELPGGKPLAFEDIPVVRALRGETVENLIGTTRRRDGTTLWVSVSAAPISAGDGRRLGAIVTLTDITLLHELQEQREDLLRAVSHDLRNPLTTVQLQAQRLLQILDRTGVMGGPERHAAEAIIIGARRMNTMIQDLVETARLEAGRLELSLQPVDLRAFVLDLLERQAEMLEVGRIRLVAPEVLPPVRADPDRLERILVNLLSNALKYSQPGTEVTVTLRVQDGQVVTAVSDRGPGIAPEDLPHIFERYYRARKGKARPEGLGLGLYITRGLVEAHGGRIWVESRVGEGSAFSFTLPQI